MKILKCQPRDNQLPQNAVEVHCQVIPMHGKLQLSIGSREKIDSIEPLDWSLPLPEAKAIIHLDFDLLMPVLTANTISKVFPNLRSLALFKVQDVRMDAFKDLKKLEQLKINQNSNALYGKTFLFSQENRKGQGLNLEHSAECFQCDVPDFPKSSFFVDFASLNNNKFMTKIKMSECPKNSSRIECSMKFSENEVITPAPQGFVAEIAVSSEPESKDLTPLVVLLIMGLWTFILSIVIIVVMVHLFKQLQKQKPTFVERFSKDALINHSEDPQAPEM